MDKEGHYAIFKGSFSWALEEMRRGRALRRRGHQSTYRLIEGKWVAWFPSPNPLPSTSGAMATSHPKWITTFAVEEILATDWEHADAAD